MIRSLRISPAGVCAARANPHYSPLTWQWTGYYFKKRILLSRSQQSVAWGRCSVGPCLQRDAFVSRKPFPKTHLQFMRGTKISGTEVKRGMVVERKGKLHEVMSVTHLTPGRRAAIIQVELKELGTGVKSNERLRSDEKIESIILEHSRAVLQRKEVDKSIFRDKDSLEEIEVPNSFIANFLPYLSPGMNLFLSRAEGKLVGARWPTDQRAMQTIKSIGSNGNAMLDNGRVVRVPEYMTVGEKIVVRLPEEVFVARAEEGDEKEEEEEEKEEEEEEEETEKKK